MTITYVIGDNLYLNITNKCQNACSFCIRDIKESFQYNLWLEKEPSLECIIEDIFSWELDKFSQLVFCGFGEPFTRLDDMLIICKRIKEVRPIPIRVNTNGLANIYYKTDITPRLKGLIDGISISLNAKNAEEYDRICHSQFGLYAFPAILDFAKRCKEHIKDVRLSVVDLLPEADLEACNGIARDLGVTLKIRHAVKE